MDLGSWKIPEQSSGQRPLQQFTINLEWPLHSVGRFHENPTVTLLSHAKKTMLSFQTPPSHSKALVTYCYLTLIHHGKDIWDGISSTSSDQSAIPKSCFGHSALSAMEGMSLLSWKITLSCKHQLLTPSRLLLPQKPLQLSFLSFESSISPSLNTILVSVHHKGLCPVYSFHLVSCWKCCLPVNNSDHNEMPSFLGGEPFSWSLSPYCRHTGPSHLLYGLFVFPQKLRPIFRGLSLLFTAVTVGLRQGRCLQNI